MKRETTLWLGIETDKSQRICTATLTGNQPWADPKVARYRNLQEFQTAWNEEFSGWSFDLSIGLDYAEYARRSTAVIDWLTSTKAMAVEYFNYSSVLPHFEEDAHQRVPDTFQKAYILAVCAYHRSRSHDLARSLLRDAYSMQHRLLRWEKALNQMAATLPPSRHDPSDFFTPF